MAEALCKLVRHEAQRAIQIDKTLGQDAGPSDRPAQSIVEWEEQLVLARRGQGRFRQEVARIKKHCRVTGVNRPEYLIVSHGKPWRDSDNAERLDGENGLLLSPSIDHLFDRGFISFENDGNLLVSRVAHEVSPHKMGVPVGARFNAGAFSEGQRRYVEFHRESVFLEAARRG
ncbi:MAG: HNH endonuclease signature motif containing protein [Steroidobacteraceae bacterium]